MSKRLQESQVDVPSDANALIIILVLAPSPGYGCTSAKKKRETKLAFVVIFQCLTFPYIFYKHAENNSIYSFVIFT